MSPASLSSGQFQKLHKLQAIAKRGGVAEALTGIDRLLQESPKFVPARLFRAHLYLKGGDASSALSDIDTALQLEPDSTQILLHKVYALRGLRRFSDAQFLLEDIDRRSGLDAKTLEAVGSLYIQFAAYEHAERAFTRAIERGPVTERLLFNRLSVRRFLGQIEGASEDCEELVARGTSIYEVHLIRSHLRSQTRESNHISTLQNLLGNPKLPWLSIVQLLYAQGKEYEDLEDFPGAFRCFAQGAALRRQYLKYDLRADIGVMSAIQETLDKSWFEQSRPSTSSAAPVFVMGLPRSGTTLVERIISCHPDVEAAAELTSFSEALVVSAEKKSSVRGMDKLALLKASRDLDHDFFAEAYLERARSQLGDYPLFIDKLPFNYLYCGLIKKVFPQARIVVVRRHPVASCFAMYKTWFNQGYPFSYDFEELASYYMAFDRLMLHWVNLLGSDVYQIHYETLVNDLPGEARGLIAACGLPWDEQCLRPHENALASTTASAIQVRQPVQKRSAELWRRYGALLDPLKNALLDAGLAEHQIA